MFKYLEIFSQNKLMWIPTLILFTIGSAWLSFKNNDSKNFNYLIAMYLIGFIPIWGIVSKYSKSLVLDALLYDVLQTIFYGFTITYLMNQSLSKINIIGILVVVVGLILVKI